MPARAVAFMSFALLLISKLFSSRLSTRQKNAINRQKKRDPLPLLTSLFFNFLLLEGVAGLWLLLSGGGLSHNLRSASFFLSVCLYFVRVSFVHLLRSILAQQADTHKMLLLLGADSSRKAFLSF
jgi:lysylphosphatidylglycerol synthetase-like protein (DUF2156 family)